jgi:cytolysin (calcineurin-like family phosphatase)
MRRWIALKGCPIVFAVAACGGCSNTDGAAGDAGGPAVDSGSSSPIDSGQGGQADGTTPSADSGVSGHDAGSFDSSVGDASVGDDASQDASTSSDSSAPQPDAPTGQDAGRGPFDITFIVMADSHADPMPEDDLLSQVRAINAVSKTGMWPDSIGGTATHFLGGPIATPLGVVICGDLTGGGTAPTEIPMFRSYFEMGNSADSINYPAYVGMGNHDIDTADRDDATANAYRATYWQYVDSRYKGPQAPIPVTNFDPGSHNYSWDWAGVHLIMTHRFAGDTGYGLPSSLPWLASDLQTYASDGRPVFVFHHYGMDAFGTNGQWWTADDRLNYRTLLTGFHVTAIMTGHTHYAFGYTWDGLNVLQVNNAKAEINTGNNDGKGSFAVVRVTDTQFDMMTVRWTDDQGGFELIDPIFSGPVDPGPAPPTTLVPSGDFATTGACTNITLQGQNVLAASCPTASGAQMSTTLDLNTCITNDNGGLMWSNPGNYSGSCSGCSLSGTLLTCQCSNTSGQSQSTTIDVNHQITNCNGTLKWGPC